MKEKIELLTNDLISVLESISERSEVKDDKFKIIAEKILNIVFKVKELVDDDSSDELLHEIHLLFEQTLSVFKKEEDISLDRQDGYNQYENQYNLLKKFLTKNNSQYNLKLFYNVQRYTDKLLTEVLSWNDDEENQRVRHGIRLYDLKNDLSISLSLIQSDIDESTSPFILYGLSRILFKLCQNIEPPHVANILYHGSELEELLGAFNYKNEKIKRVEEDYYKYASQINQINQLYSNFIAPVNDPSLEDRIKKFDETYNEFYKNKGVVERFNLAEKNANDLLSKLTKSVEEFYDKKIQADEFVAEYIEGKEIKNHSSYITIIPKKQTFDDLLTSLIEEIKTQKELRQKENDELKASKLEFETYTRSVKDEIKTVLGDSVSAGLSRAVEQSRKSMQVKGTIYLIISYLLFSLLFFILLLFYYPELVGLVLGLENSSPFFQAIHKNITTIESFYVLLFQRISLVAPILWMALNTAFKSGQYFRLQQEYVHKKSVAMSFEGYKTQANELGSQNERQEMLNKLLKTAIDTIGKNPANTLDKIKGNKAALELMNEQLNTTLEQFSKLKDLLSSEQSSKEKDADIT